MVRTREGRRQAIAVALAPFFTRRMKLSRCCAAPGSRRIFAETVCTADFTYGKQRRLQVRFAESFRKNGCFAAHSAVKPFRASLYANGIPRIDGAFLGKCSIGLRMGVDVNGTCSATSGPSATRSAANFAELRASRYGLSNIARELYAGLETGNLGGSGWSGNIAGNSKRTGRLSSGIAEPFDPSAIGGFLADF